MDSSVSSDGVHTQQNSIIEMQTKDGEEKNWSLPLQNLLQTTSLNHCTPSIHFHTSKFWYSCLKCYF